MDNTNLEKPKYELITEDLHARIAENDFSYDTVFCTEKQLSEKYGVSRITAKRAITELEQRGVLYRRRGVGSFVNRGYNANATPAKPAAGAAPKVIAMLLPFDATMGGLYGTIDTLSRSLNKEGYYVSLYITDRSPKKERANIKLLLSQHIAGLVYYPISDEINLNLLNEFAFGNLPVVIIDKATDCPYLSNVVSDNFEGGRLATEHLLSLGHKNIAFFSTAPVDSTSSVRNRFGGYLQALRTAGLSPSARNIVYLSCTVLENSRAGGKDVQLFLEKARQMADAGITAIVAENDTIAATLKGSFESIGLRVPEDISICGFDNTIQAQELGLTTINQDFSQIGEEISKIVLQAINDPAATAQKITVPVKLLARGSTAPKP